MRNQVECWNQRERKARKARITWRIVSRVFPFRASSPPVPFPHITRVSLEARVWRHHGDLGIVLGGPLPIFHPREFPRWRWCIIGISRGIVSRDSTKIYAGIVNAFTKIEDKWKGQPVKMSCPFSLSFTILIHVDTKNRSNLFSKGRVELIKPNLFQLEIIGSRSKK